MTLFTKEGKRFPFPDLLVYSEELLEANEVPIMGSLVKTVNYFLPKGSITDVDWVLNRYLMLLLIFCHVKFVVIILDFCMAPKSYLIYRTC